MSSNQIVRFFPDTDLRNSHIGLAIIAKENGLDVKDLKNGEFLVFCNVAQTQLKVYANNHVIAHLRSPKGRLDMRAIVYLPRTFNGRAFDYDAAVKKLFEQRGFIQRLKKVG